MLENKIIVRSNTYFQKIRNSFHENEFSQQRNCYIISARDRERERNKRKNIIPVKFFPVITKNISDNDIAQKPALMRG